MSVSINSASTISKVQSISGSAGSIYFDALMGSLTITGSSSFTNSKALEGKGGFAYF